MLEMLKPEHLEFQQSREQLVSALSNARIDVICPCHAVAQFLLPQRETYSILAEYAAAGMYTSVLFRDLWKLNRNGNAAIRETDPSQTLEEVIFVRRELVDDPSAVVRDPQLQEVFEAAETPTAFFPTYQIGPPLGSQPGSAEFAHCLRQAFVFLNRIGLVSPTLVRGRFAHTTILMLIRRALGLRNHRWLVPYIHDPPGFVALALAHSFNLEGDNQEQLRAALFDILADSFEPNPAAPCALPEVRLHARDALNILVLLQRRHLDLASRLTELLQSVLAFSSDSSADPRPTLPTGDRTVAVKTVVSVDLSRYSDIARELEEHLDPQAVAALQRQIGSLIQTALNSALGLSAQVPHVSTGDGAILLFDSAVAAVHFAEALQRLAHVHNATRQRPHAQRHFRVGVSTGALMLEGQGAGQCNVKFYGSAVSDAVRLDQACRTGEILVDEDTWAELDRDTRHAFGKQEEVAGKRAERYRAHRRTIVVRAPWDEDKSTVGH